MSIPSAPPPQTILAIDPGREKTGMAVVRADGSCAERQIVPTGELLERAASAVAEHGLAVVVVGDRTGSREAAAQLTHLEGICVERVDEHRSTEQARALYFQETPPTGIRRLIPLSMQVPPHPIDDYAAWILGRRYFAHAPGRERESQ